MRILMVSAAYPPDRCGIGDYACRLATRLAERGVVEPAVLTGSPGASSHLPGLKIMRTWGGRVRSTDLWCAVRAFAPDVVHVQHPTRRVTRPLVLSFAKPAGSSRLVLTIHEFDFAWHWSHRFGLRAVDGVLHVRPDLPARLPERVRQHLRRARFEFVANGRTVPALALTDEERAETLQAIGARRPVVAFFGFAHPNKAVHLLYEIAHPAKHHLLLICELDRANDYQHHILELAESEPWRGRVTVTGFVDALRAARLLAAADAVVFPFPEGAGSWNTSVNAALGSGSLVLATSRDAAGPSYDARRNLFLAPPGAVGELRAGLARHLGARVAPDTTDDWERIAQAHERFYERVARA